jgi:hypothetical protein
LLPDPGWPGVAVVLPDQGQMPRYGHDHAGVDVPAEVSLAARRCGGGVGGATGQGLVEKAATRRCRLVAASSVCSERRNRRPPGPPRAPHVVVDTPAGAEQFAGRPATSACDGILGRESGTCRPLASITVGQAIWRSDLSGRPAGMGGQQDGTDCAVRRSEASGIARPPLTAEAQSQRVGSAGTLVEVAGWVTWSDEAPWAPLTTSCEGHRLQGPMRGRGRL